MALHHSLSVCRAKVACLQVMTVVKKLTQMNLTVCATIHSPTPYCFNQFDRLHLLLRGQTVYFGPNGAPQLHCSCTDPRHCHRTGVTSCALNRHGIRQGAEGSAGFTTIIAQGC